MTKPEFTMPSDAFQRILNYLATRPYSEVHDLIAEILKHNTKPEPADPEPSP